MAIGKITSKIKSDEKSKTLLQTQDNLTQSNIPFIKVPNNIIKYSLKYNHTILPIYLYCQTHAEIYNNNYCSFSLSFLLSYFVSGDKKRRMSSQFSNGFDVLLYGSYDNNNEENKNNIKMSNSFQLVYDDKYNEDTQIPINDSITIKVLDRSSIIVNQWTPIYFDEYYYIINSIKKRNIGRVGKNEWNLIDLFNMYLYFKMMWGQFKNLSKTREVDIPYVYNNEDIEKEYNIGSKTITKYMNQLKELGLIEIISEGQYKKLSMKKKIEEEKNGERYLMSGEYGWNKYSKIMGEPIKYGYNSRESKHIIWISEEWKNK